MRPEDTTPGEGDKPWQQHAVEWLREKAREAKSWGGPTRYPTIDELIDELELVGWVRGKMPEAEAEPPICDVCLRRRITLDDLDAFPDGTSVSEIKAAFDEPTCISRASGPCVSMAWDRVRKLEALIRLAVADRSRNSDG